MKLKHLPVILLVCITGNVSAQKFQHSLGGTISIVTAKIVVNDDPIWGSPDTDNFTLIQSGATYFPRLSFLEKENASLSVGIPVTLGFGSASNMTDDSKGIFFTFDVPVMADYNIGLGSTPDNERSFGWFIGGGFGYNHTGVELSSGSEKMKSYGPLVHAGTRFDMGRRGKMTIGLVYKSGMKKEKFKTYGMQVLADL